MSLPIILIITSFPPRKCGIATYSQDLIKAIEDKYESSFIIKVCALKKKGTSLEYPDQVSYILNTWDEKEYVKLALQINENEQIEVIYLQHEFGLYEGLYGAYLISFLKNIKKPVITTFHTVLSNPDIQRKTILQQIAFYSASVIVMTKHSSRILSMEYDIAPLKVTIIPHGTHLIKPVAKSSQNGFPFEHKKILATFGLLSEGKSIETALSALPKIIEKFPNIIYLIIGKTHPEVIKNEGEKYRDFLKEKVRQLGIEKEVLFINKYLSLDVLLEYLQRTDIYLFTSKDPQQAVSGTLAYAMSAGCPVVSTPIPHALELLDGAGLNFDFNNHDQLADAVILLLSNNLLMYEMHMSAIHRISPTAWQNAAMAHLQIAFNMEKLIDTQLAYKTPPILLDHIKRMTTPKGMIQFAIVAEPDNSSGYTLDDNARALIAVAKHFDLTGKFDDLYLIHIYLNFILFCQQEDGSFLNYVSFEEQFGIKNQTINLEDSNGRAIWALGEYLSLGLLIDYHLQAQIEEAFEKALPIVEKFQSPRAIAFAIKGLHFYNVFKPQVELEKIITKLADNLVSKFRGVSTLDWQWYEYSLTYANSVIPEAMLYAYKTNQNYLYKEIAEASFQFLLHIIFKKEQIKVVSNQGWHHKNYESYEFGEQPIEIAYTIFALDLFYREFKELDYFIKMKYAFHWFLGANHLHQIIYNPCTGGCYDGLEKQDINLNQGAESTLSYFLSRLIIEKYELEEERE